MHGLANFKFVHYSTGIHTGYNQSKISIFFNIHIPRGGGWDNVISAVTKLGTGWSGVGIPVGAKFFCSSNRRDRLWGKYIHASNEYGGGGFSGDNAAGT